MFYSFSLH